MTMFGMKVNAIVRTAAAIMLCCMVASCGYIGAAGRTVNRSWQSVRSFESDAEREAFFQSLRDQHGVGADAETPSSADSRRR